MKYNSYITLIVDFLLDEALFPTLSSSEMSLLWKKNSSTYLKYFTDLHFFYTDVFFLFSLTNVCLSCRLRKVANRFVGSKTPKHNAFDKFWKFKSHLEHFSRNTWFLSLDDPVIICIYLKTTDRHCLDQKNIRHSTSKLLKDDFVQDFQNTYLLLVRHLLFSGKIKNLCNILI